MARYIVLPPGGRRPSRPCRCCSDPVDPIPTMFVLNFSFAKAERNFCDRCLVNYCYREPNQKRNHAPNTGVRANVPAQGVSMGEGLQFDTPEELVGYQKGAKE